MVFVFVFVFDKTERTQKRNSIFSGNGTRDVFSQLVPRVEREHQRSCVKDHKTDWKIKSVREIAIHVMSQTCCIGSR